MRIFVAGPYSSDNILGVLKNIRVGIKVSYELILKGHSVFCPFLDYQYSLVGYLDMKNYKRNSLDWLKVSEAIYYIGPSPGADVELAIAQELGLTIYHNLGEVPSASL